MNGQTYPAARVGAPRIHAPFFRHLEDARAAGQQQLASLPDVAAIERLVNAAFWASLRREEGYIPNISLAYLSPGEAWHPLMLARPLPLEPSTLSRVAPAVERPG